MPPSLSAASSAAQPRGILRPATPTYSTPTHSTPTTAKRVTFADVLETPPASLLPPPRSHAPRPRPRRPPPTIAPPSVLPPSILPPAVHGAPPRVRSDATTVSTHAQPRHESERETRRRRRRQQDGVNKKRSSTDTRRTDGAKKRNKHAKLKRARDRDRHKDAATSKHVVSSERRRCHRRGLADAKAFLARRLQLRDAEMLEVMDARSLYKMYVEVRRRVGKRVEDGLRKRMVADEWRLGLQHTDMDGKTARRRRRLIEAFVAKQLPGVRAQRLSRTQLGRAAVAAAAARAERLHRARSKARGG